MLDEFQFSEKAFARVFDVLRPSHDAGGLHALRKFFSAE
jgi:hypothetical protein